ncbi:MAG: sigma-54-dependent Fis family transcriptional regulator [Prolixibacteraceae bacterium]|nr:sigma-54-dependent Fis family transcriptional regulator [Prolixibacteraceae bacterium]MBN2774801.1 sigma-54-dependent Fis family transcriptional regulator [Prolixibacteraceae bacterium]
MKPKNYKIFIVEDNALYAKVLKRQLSQNESYNVKTFETGRECIANLSDEPDVITLDYTLPDMNGAEILKEIRSELPSTHVIIISGQNDINTAVKLLKDGAYDYITKGPDTRERLENIIKNIHESDQLRIENTLLRDVVKKKYDFKNLIKGGSREIDHVFDLMTKAVQTNISVSVTGETGTGKELIAKGIHYNSPRSNKPFVPVNISAIPESLIESELFGHEKGSFTGADSRKIGKFEAAHGGTLFLDEIAELDINIQTKLLRVIQERELTRVGGLESIPIDVRIITATHKKLPTLVAEGKFRQDLYYRLLGLPIEAPPLRDRGNDVILLAKYFVNEFCKDNGLPLKNLSNEVTNKLLSYPFPGNIRELKAIMELSCVMSNDENIEVQHLNLNFKDDVTNLLAKEKTLEEYTEEIINHFLNNYNNNVRLVASKLNIGKSTIYRMLQKNPN